MSRSLEDYGVVNADAPTADEPRAVRTTARAFAAAISALLISTLVVSRSGAALDPDGSVSGVVATAGVIALSDDDAGQALFDLRDIGPARPFERCLEVTYEGTVVPVALTMLATVEGDLGPYLNTTVETGHGGTFESCEGFTAEAVLFRGTLVELANGGPRPVRTFFNTGDRQSFRIRIQLADTNDALGLAATTGFVWEVVPT